MSEKLQELMDKRALDELIYSTMHAMDSSDWPAYRKGMTDDAEYDFTSHGVATDKAAEIMKGADYFITVLAGVLEGFESTQHHVTNILHTLNGDTATTNCYVFSEHFLNNDRGDRSVSCGGRYEVATVRTAQGWKVVKWRFIASWFRGNTMLYQLASAIARQRSEAK